MKMGFVAGSFKNLRQNSVTPVETSKLTKVEEAIRHTRQMSVDISQDQSRLQDDMAASAARSRNNLAKRRGALKAGRAVGAFSCASRDAVAAIKEHRLNNLIAVRAVEKQASKAAARAAAANSGKSSNFESKGRKAADCGAVAKQTGGAQKSAGEEVRGAEEPASQSGNGKRGA